MFKRLYKGKYGVFIALCTLIVMVGIFHQGSVKAFASEPYIWLNKIDTTNITISEIVSSGTFLFHHNSYDVYIVGNEHYTGGIKCAIELNNWGPGGYINFVFAISDEYASYNDTATVIVSCKDNGTIYNSYQPSVLQHKNGMYYYSSQWSGIRSYNTSIPAYNNINDVLNAFNDGNWSGPVPPHDPEYSYNADLGSLQNVYFRQVYNTVNNESIIDISYNQYTSTGVDLSQNGYGIATQVIKKDLSSQTVQISNTLERAWDNTKKTILKIVTNYINEWGLNLGIPDGGGHSFAFDDEEPANALTKYDILLRPYYYDGLDYSYGDTTIIEDVDINKVGTRMMKNADTTVNDDPVDINYTKVKITNYDFTWNSSNISYNEYMNYNIMNEETVYNYTLYSNDSTEINNIGYSTTNIYNYDGDNPNFTFNDFNITQQDVINTVKSFKDVWSAIIYFVPHVLGLFAYLPTWSLVLVSGCFIILASVCVVKFVAPLL